MPATAAIEGKVKIPNLGTNRYTMTVTPPDSTNFVQTTTLEGNHDWDSWIMEGATGLDTEFVVAGEPFPAVIFGYAPGGRNTLPARAAGTIKGVVDAVKVYVPSTGGLPIGGDICGGLTGGKIDGPIANPWVALTDLDNGDTAVWVGQGDANGTFRIPNVPDGNYTLTWWDEPQDYILDDPERHRRQRRDGRPGHAAAHRLVDRVRRATSSTTPTATARWTGPTPTTTAAPRPAKASRASPTTRSRCAGARTR